MSNKFTQALKTRMFLKTNKKIKFSPKYINPISAGYIVGIDEAGRGPIAGPVSVGVFVCTQEFSKKLKKKFIGLDDSKKLSEIQRERIFSQIEISKENGEVDFCVTLVSSKIVDQKGITKAVQIGIDKGIKRLNLDCEKTFIYLDGLLKAPKEFSQKTVIKGDSKIPSISVASICAKVIRDRYMKKISSKYPLYGFEKHKGYGTLSHRNTIKEKGFCPIHRKTFKCG